jgi:hypothetical protein
MVVPQTCQKHLKTLFEFIMANVFVENIYRFISKCQFKTIIIIIPEEAEIDEDEYGLTKRKKKEHGVCNIIEFLL